MGGREGRREGGKEREREKIGSWKDKVQCNIIW